MLVNQTTNLSHKKWNSLIFLHLKNYKSSSKTQIKTRFKKRKNLTKRWNSYIPNTIKQNRKRSKFKTNELRYMKNFKKYKQNWKMRFDFVFSSRANLILCTIQIWNTNPSSTSLTRNIKNYRSSTIHKTLSTMKSSYKIKTLGSIKIKLRWPWCIWGLWQKYSKSLAQKVQMQSTFCQKSWTTWKINVSISKTK